MFKSEDKKASKKSSPFLSRSLETSLSDITRYCRDFPEDTIMTYDDRFLALTYNDVFVAAKNIQFYLTGGIPEDLNIRAKQYEKILDIYTLLIKICAEHLSELLDDPQFHLKKSLVQKIKNTAERDIQNILDESNKKLIELLGSGFSWSLLLVKKQRDTESIIKLEEHIQAIASICPHGYAPLNPKKDDPFIRKKYLRLAENDFKCASSLGKNAFMNYIIDIDFSGDLRRRKESFHMEEIKHIDDFFKRKKPLEEWMVTYMSVLLYEFMFYVLSQQSGEKALEVNLISQNFSKFKKFIVGKEYKDYSYVSTTTNLNFAVAFGKMFDVNTVCILRMHIPIGSKIAAIDCMGMDFNHLFIQNEILLERNKTFRILDVSEAAPQHYIFDVLLLN